MLIRTNELLIDTKSNTVTIIVAFHPEATVQLNPKEMELLSFFAKNASVVRVDLNKIYAKQTLCHAIGVGALDSIMRNLRSKLSCGYYPEECFIAATSHGGYIFRQTLKEMTHERSDAIQNVFEKTYGEQEEPIFLEDMPHPQQPIGYVDNVVRFKKNEIVRFLLDNSKFDLNQIEIMYRKKAFSQEDYIQFNQLLGWSVCGFNEKSGIPEDVKDRAEKIMDAVILRKKKLEI